MPGKVAASPMLQYIESTSKPVSEEEWLCYDHFTRPGRWLPAQYLCRLLVLTVVVCVWVCGCVGVFVRSRSAGVECCLKPILTSNCNTILYRG
jgi:hypothetical protein